MPFLAARLVDPMALAADLSDASSDRRLYLAAGGLAVLGVALTVATAWWWRASRPDHRALGPLEVMSRSKFTAMSSAERRSALDAARPRPASGHRDDRPGDAPLDLERAANEPLRPIDDLREPAEG